jgi:hypothetical protein
LLRLGRAVEHLLLLLGAVFLHRLRRGHGERAHVLLLVLLLVLPPPPPRWLARCSGGMEALVQRLRDAAAHSHGARRRPTCREKCDLLGRKATGGQIN